MPTVEWSLVETGGSTNESQTKFGKLVNIWFQTSPGCISYPGWFSNMKIKVIMFTQI